MSSHFRVAVKFFGRPLMACVKLKKSHTGIKNQSEMLDLGSHNSLLQHDMCPHFVLQKSLPPSIHPSLGSTLTRHPIRIDTGSGGEGRGVSLPVRGGGGGIFGSMRSEGRLRGGEEAKHRPLRFLLYWIILPAQFNGQFRQFWDNLSQLTIRWTILIFFKTYFVPSFKTTCTLCTVNNCPRYYGKIY